MPKSQGRRHPGSLQTFASLPRVPRVVSSVVPRRPPSMVCTVPAHKHAEIAMYARQPNFIPDVVVPCTPPMRPGRYPSRQKGAWLLAAYCERSTPPTTDTGVSRFAGHPSKTRRRADDLQRPTPSTRIQGVRNRRRPSVVRSGIPPIGGLPAAPASGFGPWVIRPYGSNTASLRCSDRREVHPPSCRAGTCTKQSTLPLVRLAPPSTTARVSIEKMREGLAGRHRL